MKCVYKYELVMDDVVSIDIPADADILYVAVQHGKPCLWVLVDTEHLTKPFRFRVAGTGHPVDSEGCAYVGTFMLSGGALVFHVFELA